MLKHYFILIKQKAQEADRCVLEGPDVGIMW